MKKLILSAALTLTAAPAFAAGDAFFSLANTDFVVLLAFLLFVAVLVYFGVPKQVAAMLDKRGAEIRSELEEARALRDEAQTLLASYDRKSRDVQAQADRIVANARDEARRAADEAKAEISRSVDRRLAGAEDQIASAQAAAVREIRDRAIAVAIGAARDVIAEKLSAQQQNALIDESIDTVSAKLH